MDDHQSVIPTGPVTLTFPLFQWRGQWNVGENKVDAVRTEIYPVGSTLRVTGKDGDFLCVVSERGQREDMTPGTLRALTMTPWHEFPCRNCDTPTTHPWEVCPKCLRDPETNRCETCLRHSPGIPYPYICGNCLK